MVYSFQVKPYICTNNGLFEISQTDEENIFSESYTSVECLSIKDDEKSQNNFNNGAPVDVKEIKHGKKLHYLKVILNISSIS